MLIIISTPLYAFPFEPFTANYEINLITGLKAKAEMKLEKQGKSLFYLSTLAKLYFLGGNITTAKATGSFNRQDENIFPVIYEYKQTGIGKRTRSISYDWDNKQAITEVEGDNDILALGDSMFDELSMYMELQQQASKGIENIYLNVIDENEIKRYHYQFVQDEMLELDTGSYNAVKYRRVRDPDSKRKTEIWFAKDWNYIVLKLDQKTSIRTFTLFLLEAILNDEPVTPL